MSTRSVFVGIGSGVIQLGLWAYFAHLKRARIVLAEVDSKKVSQIRKNRGFYSINIVRGDRIEKIRIGPVLALNPAIPKEWKQLVRSIASATDVVTAVPSTREYSGSGGVASLLREGLSGSRHAVNVYASENEIGAARMLKRETFGGRVPGNVRFRETVIERMGGPQPPGRGLAPLTPGAGQALLVEDFHRIIIEEAGTNTIFDMFQPSRNVILFEELKLYGHNAVHFLLGAYGKLKGYRYMSEFNGDPDLARIGLDALRYETGGWFKRKYRTSGERVATSDGFEGWAVRLTRRIVNPLLHDRVERIIREPERKLGWDDRIIGTMRRALAAGVTPRRYATGVAAALTVICGRRRVRRYGIERLTAMWGRRAKGAAKDRIIGLVVRALDGLVEG